VVDSALGQFPPFATVSNQADPRTTLPRARARSVDLDGWGIVAPSLFEIEPLQDQNANRSGESSSINRTQGSRADHNALEKVGRSAVRRNDKNAKLKQQMQGSQGDGATEQRLRDAPDGRVSLTDPDTRSMAISGRRTVIVANN
jgi:hypothetical protein